MKYAALLRSISPLNPNMRNEKLRGVFESLGFKNVRTVISSGNVLFETGRRDKKALADSIEQALSARLGFKSAAIIRSLPELHKLVDADPFKGNSDIPAARLVVMFLKSGGEEFGQVDETRNKTPDFMTEMEKKHGKENTTRTWKTVLRILNKLGES